MRNLSWFRHLVVVLTALSPLTVFGQPQNKSAVPPWDARGVGPLPWQGIACVDINGDASRIALGTIAPPGDPNVVLLDGAGKVVRTAQAGQRWIGQVAASRGDLVYALCTMPAGRASDFPTVYTCGKEMTAIPPQRGEDGWTQNMFHYGAHSNHIGVIVRGSERGGALVYGNRIHWLEDKDLAPLNVSLPPESVTVSMIVGPGGDVLLGCSGKDSEERNLHLLSPHSRKPLWSRPALTDIDKVAPPEKGKYGTPTLPDGRREELPQKDVPVFAPLSLAMAGQGESLRIATADYPGWQRWVRSSATLQQQNNGTRFLPARPVVSVYDGQGKLRRRFGPESFKTPAWLDLVFLSGGKYLLAYPHHWTCRGLAGQTILPADDNVRTVFILDVESGKVRTLDFPDAVADLAVSDTGRIVAACWNGKAYLLDEKHLLAGKLPAGIDVGGPALVRISRDGQRIVCATTKGEVRLLDGTGAEIWRKDLNTALTPGLKPWVANARAVPLGPGVWQLPGGRVESDLGGQRVVEAPDGLILIEGHAGLSFDREWASMKAVGLDPMRIKYVLATHEHGDHAPGTYLWRVATGAKFVCSEEMAYTLQHHVPLGSGYGLHPPVPTDIRITQDTDLDLAGLRVKAVRLPGHTFGSMGWYFREAGTSYIAFGDLIMPHGPLGYSGSINFSGSDVLASLRKLKALKPDFALPGHGATGDPGPYIEEGIQVGTRVGWGKIRPETPDPYFRITQKNVQVVAWNIDATSAAFGDLDGNGTPDIAIVAPDKEGAVVKIFLNKAGKFAARSDHTITLPGLQAPTKIRIAHLNDDKIADIFVGGKSAALVLSQGKWPVYKVVSVPLADAHQVRWAALDGKGTKQIVIGARFNGYHVVSGVQGDRATLKPLVPEVRGPYADVRFVDLNGDGRTDVIASNGNIYLRQADGALPAKPSVHLRAPDEKDWTFLAVGDFNGDKRPDVALLSYGMKQMRLSVFHNTGDQARPFAEQPTTRLDLSQPGAKNQPSSLRDAPVVADWNGDGIADLVVGKGQDNRVLILLGGRDGLNLKRSTAITLDYRVHYETGLCVADFNGDGLPDLACLGYTSTGVGQNGPMAAYLWLQPAPQK